LAVIKKYTAQKDKMCKHVNNRLFSKLLLAISKLFLTFVFSDQFYFVVIKDVFIVHRGVR